MHVILGIPITSKELWFIIGIAALWIFSAAVDALTEPTDKSGPFYRWFYKFSKALAGDIFSVFGKYLPKSDNQK